jgi:excisionase family DNA binding protein
MSELMTLEELAQYLRFTTKTIYKLLKQDRIPAVKIGSKWRFDKQVIDDWLHQQMKSGKTSILVIDDDPFIQSLIKETLEEQGHTVITVGTGTEGIEAIKHQEFDLVLLDLKMPDINGDEILKQVKYARPKLPVTIITGYPGSEMMERALKQSPFGVMNKPFDASDISAVVNNFLHINAAKR